MGRPALGSNKPKFTEEMKVQLRDPLWRLQNLYHIKTKAGTVQKLTLNRAQQELIRLGKGRDIVLKSRQMGVSTFFLLRLLDKTIFTPNTTSVILAHKRESVQKLFRMIKFAYDLWPSHLPKPAATYDNKNELFFAEINSTIYVSMEVRGDALNHVHFSELAFTEEAEDKFIATLAAVVPGGNVTIESTANGVGNFFYDFYTTALQRGFTPIFCPWYWADEYKMPVTNQEFDADALAIKARYGLTDEQLTWMAHMKSLLGAKFQQEFPANASEAFIASGGNVFPLEELDQFEPATPLISTTDGLVVFREPQIGHAYAMGVDVAEGVAKDESAIDIIDTATGEQVYHWSGHCTVPLLAEKVETAAKKYNKAYVIPESNNHGFSLIHMLKDRGLTIYQREKLDGPVVKRFKRLGWLTTKRTKPLLIQALINALYEKDIKINYAKTLGQMRTYITNPETGEMGAAPGKWDDCVMSLALAWQGIRLTTSSEKTAVESLEFNEREFTSIAY